MTRSGAYWREVSRALMAERDRYPIGGERWRELADAITLALYISTFRF